MFEYKEKALALAIEACGPRGYILNEEQTEELVEVAKVFFSFLEPSSPGLEEDIFIVDISPRHQEDEKEAEKAD